MIGPQKMRSGIHDEIKFNGTGVDDEVALSKSLDDRYYVFQF